MLLTCVTVEHFYSTHLTPGDIHVENYVDSSIINKLTYITMNIQKSNIIY